MTLFYENSTRTRMSFELASKYMSAAAANISASRLLRGRRARPCWTPAARWTDMGTDVIMHPPPHVRRAAPARPARARRRSSTPATASTSIPTQALLDMFTMQAPRRADLDGTQGRRRRRRAPQRAWRARTSAACAPWARRSRCAGPPTLMPAQIWRRMDVKAYHPRRGGTVAGADVVMGLRIQQRAPAGAAISVLPSAGYPEFSGITDRAHGAGCQARRARHAPRPRQPRRRAAL